MNTAPGESEEPCFQAKCEMRTCPELQVISSRPVNPQGACLDEHQVRVAKSCLTAHGSCRHGATATPAGLRELGRVSAKRPAGNPAQCVFRFKRKYNVRHIIIPNADVKLSTTAKMGMMDAFRISPRKTTASGPA